MALSVKICVVTYTLDEQQTMAQSLIPLLRQRVPGFMLHKTGLHSGLAVIVMGCASAVSLHEAGLQSYMFLANEIKNPMNRNLLIDGVVQPLTHVTNI
eukprot:m51a1_g1393 hypothetical protein (98) ;mRNA; f:480869-481162